MDVPANVFLRYCFRLESSPPCPAFENTPCVEGPLPSRQMQEQPFANLDCGLQGAVSHRFKRDKSLADTSPGVGTFPAGCAAWLSVALRLVVFEPARGSACAACARSEAMLGVRIFLEACLKRHRSFFGVAEQKTRPQQRQQRFDCGQYMCLVEIINR